MAAKNYYTLAASLPSLPYFEQARRLPINEVRLQKRMKMLDDDDLSILKKVGDFIAFEHQPQERTDSDVARLYGEIETLTLHHRGIWRLIESGMSLRTIIVALRRRRRNMGPPGKKDCWGVGPWIEHIVRHWDHPDFMLALSFPWLPEARALLESGKAFELEKLHKREGWKCADSMMSENPFSFDAIVAYLSKWNIIRQWLVYDSAAAASRFNTLILEVTRGQEQLFDNK